LGLPGCPKFSLREPTSKGRKGIGKSNERRGDGKESEKMDEKVTAREMIVQF